MSEKNDVQKIRLVAKHPAVGGTRSQVSDGFVSFSVGSRYKLLETIGTGAYGVVCSAIDTKTSCHVAIKKIVNPFEVLTTAKRTLRELKLLLHFKHDNIVGIKNVIQSDQKNCTDVYLVMDLMESDLHHIIRSEQPLSAEHICYFLYQLLRGLKYIHSANVIHRDLKPSNLLVNENCELKIGDFGMARAVSSTPDDQKFFMTEYVATRWYRAPELMLSIGEYSQAIDMWSVGCIFAEMMGRKQLFPGRHYVHQLQLVISILGSPDNDLVTSIRSERVRNYVRGLPHREPVKFQALYPKASEQMLELLQSFLQFDPSVRPTAEQTLDHPFFGGYHDVDDEPRCPLPFDFRFEATVTKDAVREQAAAAIHTYRERKSRLSQQLIVVHEKSADNSVSSLTAPSPLSQTIPHVVNKTIASSAATTASVFKKPPVPSTAHKAILPKPVNHLLTKPSSDDVDMKSANSVCSMDISIELDSKTAKQARQGAFSGGSRSSKTDSKHTTGLNQIPPVSSQPMITVQVVQDNSTVDLTEIDSTKADVVKKQSNKQKKENEKGPSKKSSSSTTKKTTISENTKMKIRDSIFANMFAKQKGLGKPLEKVKKSVTAAERQREREEKRKKRLERAAEKERKREEERKKDQLSDADKNLLDRWKKMQTKTKDDEPVSSTTRESKPERAGSSKSVKEGRREGRGVNRHKSLPSSTPRTYQPTNIHNKDNQQPPSTGATSSSLFPVQPNNRLITVLLSGSTGKPREVPPGASGGTIVVPTHRVDNSHETLNQSSTGNVPLHYIGDPIGANAPEPHSRTTSFANAAYQFPATEQSQLPTNQGFVFDNSFKNNSGQTNLSRGIDPDISNLRQQPITDAGDNQRIYGGVGGVFIPESDGATQNGRQLKGSKPDESGLLRPTSLFSNENDPKVAVLVGDELMTPGKALQHSNLITTPQGRHLTTLSPDTIDFVLNDEFQKRTNIEGGKIPPATGRPASYPSGSSSSVQDPPADDNVRDPLDSSTSRSRSFSFLSPMPISDGSNVNMTSSHSVRQHSNSEPPNIKKGFDTDKTNTGSLTSSLFRHIQEFIDDRKSHSGSSYDYSLGSFIKSPDDPPAFAIEKLPEPNVSTATDDVSGGVFVPHVDTTASLTVPQYSIAMNDAIPSAGAASALGYGLGVDISDIIPRSAGEGGSMEYAASTDHSDSSLLADWLNYSCLCPQDMDALQRELELGSPMSVDGP